MMATQQYFEVLLYCIYRIPSFYSLDQSPLRTMFDDVGGGDEARDLGRRLYSRPRFAG
jgi:hypothetical protein